MLAKLLRGWSWLLEWLAVIKPARLPILMVLAVLAFLIVSAQGQDVVSSTRYHRSWLSEVSLRHDLFPFASDNVSHGPIRDAAWRR